METSERQLFRVRFAWLCKWLLSDVYGGGRFYRQLGVSARTPPRPAPVRRASGDLADSTRQLVRDTALLLLLFRSWICSPWRIVFSLRLSFSGVVSVRGCLVLNGYLNTHAALVPQLFSDVTVLLDHTDHDVGRLGSAGERISAPVKQSLVVDLLACVWLIGRWNAVPGNIVGGFPLYLVSLSTNTHSVGSLINLKHHRGNRPPA